MSLAISGAALQLGGNGTDSFILQGALDNANLQQGACEILGEIQLM